MNYNKYTLDNSQMDFLKKFGLKVENTLMSNIMIDNIMTFLPSSLCIGRTSTPSLTLQELWNLIPSSIIYGETEYSLEINKKDRIIRYIDSNNNLIEDPDKILCSFPFEEFIDGLYLILCYLLDNKFI